MLLYTVICTLHAAIEYSMICDDMNTQEYITVATNHWIHIATLVYARWVMVINTPVDSKIMVLTTGIWNGLMQLTSTRGHTPPPLYIGTNAWHNLIPMNDKNTNNSLPMNRMKPYRRPNWYNWHEL